MRRRPVALLILAAMCWGGGTALSKEAVGEVPPVTLLTAQLAVSVGFLTLIGRRSGAEPGFRGTDRRLARLGLLNPGLAYALSLLGLSQVTASLSVLLWAGEPVLILVLAVLLLRERPGLALVVLSAVALGGLALVAWDPAASGAIPGIALTLAGVACCALYTVGSRRWLSDVASTLDVVAAQQRWALAFAVVLLGVAASAGAQVAPTAVSPLGIASTVASGLLYYGLAYWCYLGGLRAVPASVAAASFYLIPVFGVAAALPLGDRLSAGQWVGAAVVVGAVAAITLRTARVDGAPEVAPTA